MAQKIERVYRVAYAPRDIPAMAAAMGATERPWYSREVSLSYEPGTEPEPKSKQALAEAKRRALFLERKEFGNADTEFIVEDPKLLVNRLRDVGKKTKRRGGQRNRRNRQTISA